MLIENKFHQQPQLLIYLYTMDQLKIFEEHIRNYYTAKDISFPKIQEIVDYLREKFILYKHFLDKQFEKRLQGNEFASRMAEMYFIESLIKKNIQIEHKSNAGPDIWIKDIKGWGEFVAATDSQEYLKTQEDTILSSHEEYLLTRLTSVLNKKSTHNVSKWINKKTTESNEPIILFISSAWLKNPFLLTPEGSINTYLRAVFPISEAIVFINPITKKAFIDRKYKSCIKKANEKMIENDFFLRKENKFISAIVFSNQTIFHQFFFPKSRFKSGDDFVIVHNPMAKNPIPTGLLPGCHEYKSCLHNNKLFIKDIYTKKYRHIMRTIWRMDEKVTGTELNRFKKQNV